MSTLLGKNEQQFKILVILIYGHIILDSSCTFVPLKAYQFINYQKSILNIVYELCLLSHKSIIVNFSFSDTNA